ncbi:MAG: helix-turn-helix domain-containing protein [Pyrinomonadaceae bacterium]
MNPRIHLCIERINGDLRKPLSEVELARSLNLSVSRLCHLFKAETGLTLTQYTRAINLKEAKELLESTSLSIKEIRCRVGITDGSRFAKYFRAAYGTSPQQYRRSFSK